jgi:hypothetical protein
MLRFAWKRAMDFIAHQKVNLTGECFVTIYSKKISVTDQIVDHYLSNNKSLKKLYSARASGEHQLFISESLLEATERLIALQKAGKVASTEGAACHLVAMVDIKYLGYLIRKAKEFRPYLRELGINPKKIVNF